MVLIIVYRFVKEESFDKEKMEEKYKKLHCEEEKILPENMC